jgi:hypothetical protein
MTAGVVLLDQDRLQAAQRQMQRRRAAMQATADDHDVGGAGGHGLGARDSSRASSLAVRDDRATGVARPRRTI